MAAPMDIEDPFVPGECPGHDFARIVDILSQPSVSRKRRRAVYDKDTEDSPRAGKRAMITRFLRGARQIGGEAIDAHYSGIFNEDARQALTRTDHPGLYLAEFDRSVNEWAVSPLDPNDLGEELARERDFAISAFDLFRLVAAVVAHARFVEFNIPAVVLWVVGIPGISTHGLELLPMWASAIAADAFAPFCMRRIFCGVCDIASQHMSPLAARLSTGEKSGPLNARRTPCTANATVTATLRMLRLMQGRFAFRRAVIDILTKYDGTRQIETGETFVLAWELGVGVK